MNVKIQGGGGGIYANTGSCTGVTTYLQHEDLSQLQAGQEQEHFFNQDRDKVSAQEVTYKIDHNKGQLHKTDSKFFVITVSPSKEEIRAMGNTPSEQATALKEYIRTEVMSKYAEGFGKGLSNKDVMYFAKVHHERGSKTGEQMHAHIIVSRKDLTNTKKLSPQTNHRGKGKGAVQSGFDRTEFYKACEKGFDKKTGFERDIKDTFEYRNAMKNGTPEEIKEQTEKAVLHEGQRQKQQEQKREIKQEQQQKKGLSL